MKQPPQRIPFSPFSKPSAKLAGWALTVQEFNLTIKHLIGKSNANADTLSRNPVPVQESENSDVHVVSAMEEAVQSRQQDVAEHQEKDSNLQPILTHLKSGMLPEQEAKAKKLVIETTQYDIIDGVRTTRILTSRDVGE